MSFSAPTKKLYDIDQAQAAANRSIAASGIAVITAATQFAKPTESETVAFPAAAPALAPAAEAAAWTHT